MTNHLGNTNKMVSDTPRMDSVAGHARGIVDAAILAEGIKLERELNAVQERIKMLEEVAEDLVEESDIYDRRRIWLKAKEAKP